MSANAGSGGAAGGGSGGTGAGGTGGGTSGGAGGAGSGGTGSEPIQPMPVATFTTGLDTFIVNYYCTGPAPAGCAQIMTPTPLPEADAGADAGAGVGQSGPDGFFVVEHDTAQGDPDPGAARITVQFDGPSQIVEFAYNIATVDWTNRQGSIRVRLASGPVGTAAKMYIKTAADYNYADSGQVTLTAGETWTTLTYPPAAGGMISIVNPATYDLGDVREIGVEIAAGPTTLTPAVIYVDTLAY
jgi:mannanase-like protein